MCRFISRKARALRLPDQTFVQERKMKTTFGLLLVSVLFLGTASLMNAQTPAVTHNTWTSGAAMPMPVWGPGGTAVLKKEIYVVGGVNSSNSIIADTQIYNVATNAWSTGVSLPTTLEGGVAAVVKNILYVMGGTVDGSTYTNAVWAFNPKTKTWSSKSAMPVALHDAGVAVKNNIIYVAGGNSPQNLRATNLLSYNPATDTWTNEASMLVAVSEPSAGVVGTSMIMADGAENSGFTGYTEGYDITTNTWSALTPDPTSRSASCYGAVGSKLYVIGGTTGGEGAAAITLNESFQPSKDKWATLAAMPQASVFPGSTIYKGKLYCIGGTSVFGESSTALGNVQIYQP
jgi:N-acetylneuraminic acid mutarotase